MTLSLQQKSRSGSPLLRALGLVVSLGLLASAVAPMGCTVREPDLPETAPLPFAVSDYFLPTGFFGDPDALTIDINDNCAGRPEGAQGNCYRIHYEPLLCGSKAADDCDDDGLDEWAGIFWQYPNGNWGDELGRAVEAGATRVSFWAAVMPEEGTLEGSGKPSFLSGAAPGSDPVTGKPYPFFDLYTCTDMNGCIPPGHFDELDGSMRYFEFDLPQPNYVEINDDGEEVANWGRVYGAFGLSITAPRQALVTEGDPDRTSLGGDCEANSECVTHYCDRATSRCAHEVAYTSVTLYLDDIRWE